MPASLQPAFAPLAGQRPHLRAALDLHRRRPGHRARAELQREALLDLPGELRVLGRQGDQVQRRGQQFGRVVGGIGEAVLDGLGAGQRPAEQRHRGGPLVADPPAEQRDVPAARVDTARQEAGVQDRVRSHQQQVSGQREVHARADRAARDQRQGGNRKRADPGEGPVYGGGRRDRRRACRVGRGRGQEASVGPAAEIAAGPLDQHRAHAGVRLHLVAEGLDSGRHLQRDGVLAARVVQRHPGDTAVAGDDDLRLLARAGVFAHAVLPPGLETVLVSRGHSCPDASSMRPAIRRRQYSSLPNS